MMSISICIGNALGCDVNVKECYMTKVKLLLLYNLSLFGKLKILFPPLYKRNAN